MPTDEPLPAEPLPEPPAVDEPERRADPGVSGDPEDGPGPDVEPTGADLARTALGRARSAAQTRGLRPSARTDGRRFADLERGTPAEERQARRRAWAETSRRSGAWPDARDPQALGSNLGRLVGERGWEQPVSVGSAFGRWDVVVGPELAGHCTPETLKEGVLTVRAESTTWATQVRLLTSVLVRRLDEELGHGVVVKVVVKGPTAPSWRKGGRTAPGGRGPRDTYG